MDGKLDRRSDGKELGKKEGANEAKFDRYVGVSVGRFDIVGTIETCNELGLNIGRCEGLNDGISVGVPVG